MSETYQIHSASRTGEVAHWCNLQGFDAEVCGAWVWVSFEDKPDGETRAKLKAAGFRFSSRRQGWFHKCSVASARTRRPGHPREWYGSVPTKAFEEDN